MKIRTPLIVSLALALLLMASPAMAASGPGHDKIASAVPSSISPAVNDGQVQAIAQVGTTMVIGGTFTNLTPKGGVVTNRSRVASFDATTGDLRAFSPVLNGSVEAVLAGPTADTVYVAGSFTTVNGVAMSHLALLDVNTGAPVAGFKATSTNGAIITLVMAGSRLLLGGNFTTAGGQTHQGLASVNPTTGVIDQAFMGIDVSVRHNNSGSGAVGAVGVKDMETTPDGSKLVVIGNFRKADGLDRVQILVANLSGATAVVDPTWNTTKYAPLCYKGSFDSTVRGVSASPDGKFFVVAATGGGTKNTLCDTAARFEFGATGSDIAPTWVDSTGGDTLWSVEVTEQAVYVGGHPRWMNNVDGTDYAAQGAVPRPGLSALDIESGLPLAWNPGRLPRGLAVYEIFATPTGVWFGSDTDYIGNFKYKRPRLAYFPLVGGAVQASDNVATLPADVYLGSRTSGVANNLSTVTFNGTSASGPTTVDNRGVAWDSVRGAFMAGDQLFYGKTDGYLYQRRFTSAAVGPEVKIDPYNDPLWANVQTGSGGTERGVVPSFYGQISSLTGLFYANDRIFFTRSGDSHLYWRWFNVDSGIVGAQVFTADGGRSWTDTNGLFRDGTALYIVSKATGRLQRMSFLNNAPTGAVTVVDSARDWRAKTAFIGPLPNVAPTAAFTSSCSEQTCSVDATTSTDTDGTIASYAWDFGDGTTATGAKPAAHQYGTDGTYTITLTVTDNSGATNTTTRSVSVAAPASNVSFVDRSMVSVQSATPQVAIPGTVRADDQLILTATYAVSTAANPTTPAGWTLVSSKVASGLESYVWTRRAVAADAGGTVATQVSTSVKSTLALAAYRGVSSTGSIAGIASSTDAGTAQHTSPTVTAPGGGWVVQIWTDKSAATTTWTPPSGVTSRGTSFGTASGHTSALLVDSGAPVGVGTYGGAVASTDSASGRAIAWTISLKPAAPGEEPANVAPTASFTAPCAGLSCTVDGSGSTDSDGTIASYAWDFGDGMTATGAAPGAHAYAAAGTYTITLTVTDDDAATGTTTQSVTVAAPPASSSLGYVDKTLVSVQSTNPQVSVPSGVVADDQLILVGSYAIAGANPATPVGWTLVSSKIASGLESYVWTKRAVAGDGGAAVSTQLSSASAKSTLTLAAYRGVAATDGIAAFASSTDAATTQHTSPTVTVPTGGWVVQVWTEKSSATTTWTAPNGVSVRGTTFGTGTGRTSGLLVDSGGSVAAGTAGGALATTDAASGRAISWTFALQPAS